MKEKKEKKENLTKENKQKIVKEPKTKEKKSKKSKEKNKKEKKTNKFINIIKKKWLIKGSTMFLLIAIIVAAFIAIDIFMHELDITPLDFSKDKLYTLTEESKEKVKSVDKDLKIIFFNYSDDSETVTLAKQYNKANEKITIETIKSADRPDLVSKYGLTDTTAIIVVECGEKTKLLTESDLITYDMTTYETINIAEEKLTSSILNIASNEVPKVYFLQGYSNYTLENNMQAFNQYLENEVNEIASLNTISTGKVPEDCKTLVIMTPSKDFDEITTKAIKDYINNGGNILWLNEAITEQQNFPNINSILELYGIKPFELGIILESDTSKMAAGAPYAIFPTVGSTTMTRNIAQENSIILVDATKINVNEDKLEELNVNKTNLLTSSNTSIFRTNLTTATTEKQENEESGSFTIGAEFDKTITEENEETGEKEKISKLILIGENTFISDYPLSQNSTYPLIQELYNKDLVLNSIAYLVNREEDIVARKSTGTVTYSPTQAQDTIILCIIFIVPIIIIIVGIVVWIIRRRKK